ncbi:MAG: hypothetical protein EXS31_13795 [Pedosphaera sp.]|nr:hypothetical protein [Pedosphaera sp.]
MSLKAIHVLFIVASTLLALGFSGWGFSHYLSSEGAAVDLAYGIGSAAAGIGLVVYGCYFLKKLKNISFL